MHLFFQRRAIIILVLLTITAGGLWLFSNHFRAKPPVVIQTAETATTTREVLTAQHGPCLEDDEYVEYPKSTNPSLTTPTEIPTPIYIRRSSGNLLASFEVSDVWDNYHPIEIHKCGVYAIIRPKQATYAFELSRFDYSGTKTKLVDLAGEDSAKKPAVYYDYDFRVDRKENYIALKRGYLGSGDYAIVVKDLKTPEDMFVLSIQEIEKRNPDLVQDISFEGGGWTKDSRYFWADTHYGANTLGFIRIDMQTKTFDLLSAPKDVLGGDAFNIEKGLITVHPGNVWYGIADITEQEKAKRRAQGIGTELYIQDLFTGEREFVASTSEPLYYFKPRWISDTELEYDQPSGEKRIYEVK